MIEYKCDRCDRSFTTKKGRASHLKAHSNVKYRSKKKAAYENDPKLCKNCNGIIPYSSYTNLNRIKFCCMSCRATFYNQLRYHSQKKTI